jgi:transposase InsO family protein
MKQDLAIRALDMAVALRQSPEGCFHHTDRGSQYCSNAYQKRRKKHGFKASMSGKGNFYDNSMVETFFKSIKAELIWRTLWETKCLTIHLERRYKRLLRNIHFPELAHLFLTRLLLVQQFTFS